MNRLRGAGNEVQNRTLEEVPERDSVERDIPEGASSFSYRRETVHGRPEEQKYAVRHSIMNAKAGIRKALRGNEGDPVKLVGGHGASFSGSPEKK